jgi:hypothetical protein
MKQLWLALVVAAFPIASVAQMHKCVDERGVTHYTDKPRPGCKGKEVDIRPIPPLGGKIEQRSRDTALDDAGFKRRQIERERAEKQETVAEQRRCATLRNEVSRLSYPGRVVERRDAQGERVFLDDKLRDERLAKARDEMRGCP